LKSNLREPMETFGVQLISKIKAIKQIMSLIGFERKI